MQWNLVWEHHQRGAISTVKGNAESIHCTLFFYYSILYHIQIYSLLNPTVLCSNTANFWQKIYSMLFENTSPFSVNRGRKEAKNVSPFTSLILPPPPSANTLVSCLFLCFWMWSYTGSQHLPCRDKNPTNCLHRPTFLAPFSSSLLHSIYFSHLPFFFSLLFLNNHLVHISEDTVQLTEGEPPEKTYAPLNPLHLGRCKDGQHTIPASNEKTNRNREPKPHIYGKCPVHNRKHYPEV